MAGETRLDELCEAVVDCPHSTPVWTGSGVVVLRNQNIRNGRLDLSTPSYTDETHFAERTRRATPKEGDIVITREAPMGEVCAIPPNLRCCLGQRMVLLRPSPKRVDSRYLLYALQSEAVQQEIRVNDGTGSTVSNLRIPLLEDLQIPTPSLPKQRAIAHILGSLDDKIELNRRMSETLEAIGEALFKSWFVDFAPVRDKGEGRDPGLPPALAGFFPGRFVDSEVGAVPEGWRVETVGDLCSSIFSGGTPSTQERAFWNGGIPWLSSGETREKVIINTERTITEAAVTNSSTRLAPAKATVIAGAGQGNTRGQTSFLAFDSYINQSVVALVAKRHPHRLFFDLERRYEEFRRVSDAHSSRGSLTTRLVGGLPVVTPPNVLADHFERVAAPIMARVITLRTQSQTIANLREILLPKLISGELRVDAPEKFVSVG